MSSYLLDCIYAVKDDGLENYPRTEGNLANVTAAPQNTFDVDPTQKGWYLQLDKTMQSLEKVLAKPTLFNRLVYFTTYKNKDTDDPCSGAGVLAFIPSNSSPEEAH
jgi:hypothetical protein